MFRGETTTKDFRKMLDVMVNRVTIKRMTSENTKSVSRAGHYVPIKLNAEEFAMLNHCCNPRCDAGGHGKINRSELIRLLIRREYLRRTTGKSVVKNADYSSDWRAGRPKKENVEA
jgi:hypothetical protein